VSAAAKLLDRLDRVKQTGPNRWIAACPAHEDRRPSLSIRELDHGVLLLHDFGGCQTSDVLAALGLAMADLFDKPLGHYFAPSKSSIPARDLLELISHEIDVAVIALGQVLDTQQPLNELGWQRLTQAARRIGAALDHIHGH
jgi:hypothetical protein